jgi:hypothetical protein
MSEIVAPGTLRRLDQAVVVPALIADAGPDARRRFLEFFTATIRNRHTRTAYARAVGQFCAWCEERGIRLDHLQPMVIDRASGGPHAGSDGRALIFCDKST